MATLVAGGGLMDAAAAAAALQQRETIESVIRGQRRMKGTIVSVEAGKCRVIGELGEFPFSLTSVKENKRFPGRTPKAGDRCDFKLSDTNPVKATSIRVIVPKTELSAAGLCGRDEDDEAVGTAESTTTTATAAISSGGSLPRIASSTGPISAVSTTGGISASPCMTTSSSLEGGSGIEDLCSGLQRMGNISYSLFSN